MTPHTVTIGRPLHYEDILPIISQDEVPLKITIDDECLQRCHDSRSFVTDANQSRVFYGVNTGFGPMADTYIQPGEQAKLQYNLIRSHACGLGEPLPASIVRTMMFVRLHTLAQGYSGVSSSVLETLTAFIEHEIIPLVPQHGSVGASGDLVQLAHIALCLIGEGEVFYQGKKQKTEDALTQTGVAPAILRGRDGLALINGTSAMTAIALHNLHQAKNTFEFTLKSGALLLEVGAAHSECFSEDVWKVREHAGQKHVISKLNSLLHDSARIIKAPQEQPESDGTLTTTLGQRPQEIYSLRCLPQILGPIYDTIDYAQTVAIEELNSVTDNPLIFSDHITHNGNFHGDYVALEMDKLRIAMTKLSILLERQVNYLVNPNQNGTLPPFANGGTPGLELGLQAAQFVATSTTAENQTLATPIYTHSITTNNDNQDVVSLGTNSALLTRTVIENTSQVEAILLATLAQAVDILAIKTDLSQSGRQLYNEVREHFPFLEDDTYFAPELAALTRYVQTSCVYNTTLTDK